MPRRGPEVGGFSYLIDFHDSGVNSIGSCPFLQSRVYHFFTICRATTRIEKIPITPPTETEDFFGSVVDTVPAGRMVTVFT